MIFLEKFPQFTNGRLREFLKILWEVLRDFSKDPLSLPSATSEKHFQQYVFISFIRLSETRQRKQEKALKV